MPGRLAIWLEGMKVATVEQARSRMKLAYTREAIEAHGLGTPLLSLGLPISAEAFGNAVSRDFLDGLLPEGEPRRIAAEDLRIRAQDTFELIGALGRDCAGALVIQPDDLPAPPAATTLTAEPIDEERMAKLAANLRGAPLGIGERVRISLAGMQEKLLLTRMPDGSWGRPVLGTPSTHILKPQIREHPDSVENEAFSMRLAANLGVPVADVDVMTTARGQRLLVVERYDRRIHTDGAVERIHQEDFCQATRRPPSRKHQEDGGPSWREVAGVVRQVSPGDLDALFAYMTVHVLTANGDGHAKNLALLHAAPGQLRLAPLYDLLSTLPYGDDRLALHVDSVRRTDRVTRDRLINEATRWGLSRDRSSRVLEGLIAKAPSALSAAAEETAGLPAVFPETVEAQLARLRS